MTPFDVFCYTVAAGMGLLVVLLAAILIIGWIRNTDPRAESNESTDSRS